LFWTDLFIKSSSQFTKETGGGQGNVKEAGEGGVGRVRDMETKNKFSILCHIHIFIAGNIYFSLIS
jgi:hypothetical protein